MYSVKGYWLAPVGFPIRISPDQSLVADSPKLFAGSNVLHRLQLPRHPPYALIRLTIYRNNLRYTAANTSHRCRERPSFAAPHTGYTLDSQLCVYLTHTTSITEASHFRNHSLSHFHLVKELSRCKTQTGATRGLLESVFCAHLTSALPPPSQWWS